RESGVEWVVGDLRDPAAIAAGVEGADVVYHLAAVTAAKTEREYEAANAAGTRSLVHALQAGRTPPPRLVYLSSYAAVGPAIDGRPRGQQDEPAPLSAYGRSKLAGERFAREAEGNGVEVIVLRAPAVYGPGDRALLPYFRLVRSRLAPVPGGDDRRLHLIFVRDLAVALAGAAIAPGGTYAVAEPAEHLWREVVATIASVMGTRPLRLPLPPSLVRFAAATTEGIGRLSGRAVPFNREKAEEMLAPAWICDLANSELLLPSQAVTPLQEGIEQTVRWYIRQGWL
ncbi:MAG TPA: NAD-dependent epimerase/dehydratase family protein, partial [Longimicrobiaceae bacterium]|nr:NAD-dependent epimerase/dehydratase family protein [Longimicrobiaceae bacterium]